MRTRTLVCFQDGFTDIRSAIPNENTKSSFNLGTFSFSRFRGRIVKPVQKFKTGEKKSALLHIGLTE